MHRKKIPRVIFGKLLHSIPITLLSNSKKNKYPNSSLLNSRSKLKHLRYLSSGIPLACTLALLLLGVMINNPVSSEIGFALERETQNLSESKDGEEIETEEKESVNPEETPVEDPVTPENEAEELANEVVDNTAEISTLSAENPVPAATLTVSGDLSQVNPTGPGQTVYRSHGVTVNLQDITNYSLQISYANDAGNALKHETIDAVGSTISGADNKLGSAMADNTWGYAWSDSTSATDASLVYQTMPNYGAGNTIKTESITGNNVITKNVTGKLVFAAKFSNDAPAGHYRTKVLLSLTATPKMLLSTVGYMQDMNSLTCENAKLYDSATMTDRRDNSTYTVTKLDDGKCWMTQNLRLVNKAITSDDSDVSSNFTVPASSSLWRAANVNSPTTAENAWQRVHYANNTINGAYYTWCAATAGSCSSATSDGAVAGSSICPKGWRLPTKTEFDTLLGKGYGDESTIATNQGLTIGGGFFLAAGSIFDSSLQNVGSGGYYWSSTANSSSGAYRLLFSSSNVGTAYNYRYIGYSVRCIAK